MSEACRQNAAPPPDADHGMARFAQSLLSRRYVACGKPAQFRTFDGKALCPEHAEALRVALANPDTLGNVMLGRAHTPGEIARLIVPIN